MDRDGPGRIAEPERIGGAPRRASSGRGVLGLLAELLGLTLLVLGVLGTLGLLITAHRKAGPSSRELASVVAAPALDSGAIAGEVVEGPPPVVEPDPEPEAPEPEPEAPEPQEPEPQEPEVDPSVEILARVSAQREALAERLERATRRAREIGDELRRSTDRFQAGLVEARESARRRGRLSVEAEELEAEFQLVALARDVLERERIRAEEEHRREVENPGYAILPYRGASGTWRRPIPVECRDGYASLEPGGMRFSMVELLAMPGRLGPFGAAVRRLSTLLAQQGAPGGERVEPYVLFVVRPDGIRPFYEARSALEAAGIPYGYELVDQDWEIEFPSWDDPTIWDSLDDSLRRDPPPWDELAGPDPGLAGLDGDGSGASGLADPAAGGRSLGDLYGADPLLTGSGPGEPGPGNGGSLDIPTLADPTELAGSDARTGGSTVDLNELDLTPPSAGSRTASNRRLTSMNPQSGDEESDSGGVEADGLGSGGSGSQARPSRVGSLENSIVGDLVGQDPSGLIDALDDPRFVPGSALGDLNAEGRPGHPGGSLPDHLASSSRGGGRPGGNLRGGSPGEGVPNGGGGTGIGWQDGEPGSGRPGLPLLSLSPGFGPGNGQAIDPSASAGGAPNSPALGGDPGPSGPSMAPASVIAPTDSNGRGPSGAAGRPAHAAPSAAGGDGASDAINPGASSPGSGTNGDNARQGSASGSGSGSGDGDDPGSGSGSGMSRPRIELVIACGRHGVTIHPGGYRLTEKTIKANDGRLARAIEAIAASRRRQNPASDPTPTVRFLIEPGGSPNYWASRGQVELAQPSWPIVWQASPPRTFSLFGSEPW